MISCHEFLSFRFLISTSARDSYVFARDFFPGPGCFVFSSRSYCAIVMESMLVLLSTQVAPDARIAETEQLA
jgi:hypothetical protein